jgi:hypothetical protein
MKRVLPGCRNTAPVAEKGKQRSWVGPNGQYYRELPCPNCRSRGYTPCKECGIDRSSLDCPMCNGKVTLPNLFVNRPRLNICTFQKLTNLLLCISRVLVRVCSVVENVWYGKNLLMNNRGRKFDQGVFFSVSSMYHLVHCSLQLAVFLSHCL